jgi:hypothetical protein
MVLRMLAVTFSDKLKKKKRSHFGQQTRQKLFRAIFSFQVFFLLNVDFKINKFSLVSAFILVYLKRPYNKMKSHFPSF